MTRETISPDKAPLLRKWYGVRDAEGNINGKVNGRFVFSDILKSLIVFLLTAFFIAGYGAWTWYVKNKDLPQKFEKHVEQQIDTEKLLAEKLGRIEEGIKDIQRNSRREN